MHNSVFKINSLPFVHNVDNGPNGEEQHKTGDGHADDDDQRLVTD